MGEQLIEIGWTLTKWVTVPIVLVAVAIWVAKKVSK